MLRKLTPEQISDWFTFGKTVADTEFLGEEAQGSSFRRPFSRPLACAAAREPLTSVGLPVTECVGTEYTEEYKQGEAQELHVVRNDQLVYKPDMSQCESTDCTSIPVTNQKRVDMPTAKHREEILSLIESNSVVIIQGATGSGKSTQIPQYVLDSCIQRSVYCNIAVTQPRKIGASSLARWISKERSWTLGGLVGYQISLENISTKETRLLYMTTGVLLQKLVHSKNLSEFTHIFIDEVHERTEEMDFLLLVIRKLLGTNSQPVKKQYCEAVQYFLALASTNQEYPIIRSCMVYGEFALDADYLFRANSRNPYSCIQVILMSASISCKEFADYFTLPVHNGLKTACVFKVEGHPYAIEEYYLDDLKHTVHFQLPSQRIEEPMIAKEMYEVAVSLILSFDELEMTKREKTNLSVTSEHGSVLVFLPGLNEISYMHSCLSRIDNTRWQVYQLHSCVPLEEQSNVFLPTVPGYRKVILSTNITESSVTVPDVKYVIDFCLTRTLFCDKQTSYQSLRLCWASKINCQQRKGRAGRSSKGYCYRLVHKNFWTELIPEKSVPEILCCPLGTTILKVKMLDMGKPKDLLATALSPPSVSDIERTVLQLKELGALKTCVQTKENPYDGELTFLGRVLAHLPVNLHLGKLIVLGHIFGCLEECLIIAAAFSLQNFFAVPFKQHVDGYRNKLFFTENSKSDCIAIVNAFKAWQACKLKGQLRHPKEELEWGRLNSIHIRKIREVAELFHNLKRRVKAFNMCVNPQPSPMDQECVYKQRFILQVVIAGAFYPNYFIFGKCVEKIAARDLAGKDPKTTVMLKNIPPCGYLYHKQLQSLFRQCGQVKSIAYDGSKAFVEFSRNPTESFKILPAVYLSVKMSQLKIPLELNVHCLEDIGRQLQDVTAGGVESLRVNVDCQKQTVEPVEISFGTLQQSEMIPGHLHPIKITEIVEVGHFWGYRIDEKSRTVLQALSAKINQKNLVDLSVSPHSDLVCLAPFNYLENRGYYRARILYVCGDFAEVFFVDYGNRSKVPLKNLREIPSCLLELPFQALEFKICKMRPSAKSLICGEWWSYSARQRFASLVDGYTHLVKVYSLVRSVLHVDAFCYMRCKELVNIRDVLIEECYAEPAPEPYESQQSHDLLKSLSLDHVTKEEKMPVSSKQKEKHLIERLLNWFSNSKSHVPTHKVTVLGPITPYEVKCYGLTRVSQFRKAIIRKESVNSVVILDAPEDPFQQLLVAASLSANATGSTLILEETSMMPPIPGLLALLSMLFAPAIELRNWCCRLCPDNKAIQSLTIVLEALEDEVYNWAHLKSMVDKSGRHFTGVLCGLGWSQTCEAPLLPENDMELTFDVHFGMEDISEINILRTDINKLLYECAACSGQKRMTQLQENIRQKLLCLICKSKPRDKIAPTWYEKPYAWNQVDSQLIIDQSRKQPERGSDLYQLHKLVVLNV